MKRREATGWILKSAVFTPGLVSALQGCQQKLDETVDLRVLDQQQYQLCNAIADTILPKTGSPSASEVRVVEFMDLLLNDVFEPGVVDSFIEGLREFDDLCVAETGSSFSKMKPEDRAAYLNSVDQDVMGQSYEDKVPFYYTFKRLCITTYFSSEQGVKQNLDYQPVPGSYQADVELKPGEKISVGNQM